MQKQVTKDVMEVIRTMSMHEDSGFSRSYKQGLLYRLMTYQPLSRLTLKDDEFGMVSYAVNGEGELMQNKRDPRVFYYPKTGKYSFNGSLTKFCKFKVGGDGKITDGSRSYWSGRLYVVKKSGAVYSIKNDFIKDKDTFDGKEFKIDCYDLEYPNGWHMSFCKEQDLKEYFKYYTAEKDWDSLEDEFNFKDGKYRSDLYKLLDVIKKDMYPRSKSLSSLLRSDIRPGAVKLDKPIENE